MTASFSRARARISASRASTSAAERSAPAVGWATGSWMGTTGRDMARSRRAGVGPGGADEYRLGGPAPQAVRRRSAADGARPKAEQFPAGRGPRVNVAITTPLHAAPAEVEA